MGAGLAESGNRYAEADISIEEAMWNGAKMGSKVLILQCPRNSQLFRAVAH